MFINAASIGEIVLDQIKWEDEKARSSHGK
jgi:hypothetical protein